MKNRSSLTIIPGARSFGGGGYISPIKDNRGATSRKISSRTVHPRGELSKIRSCESTFSLPNKYDLYKKKKRKEKGKTKETHYIRAYHRHVCAAMETT